MRAANADRLALVSIHGFFIADPAGDIGLSKFFIAILLLFLTACSSSQIIAAATSASSPTWTVLVASPIATPPALPFVTNTPTNTQTPIPISSSAAVSTGSTQTSLPPIQPGQPFVLSTMNMLDEHNGWGLESTGHLLRTIDGGYSWKDVTPPEAGFFSTGDMMHAWAFVKTRGACDVCPGGWTMGLVTWRTSDGGQTWQRGLFFSPDMLDFRPIAMQFVDDAKGWFLLVEQVGMSGFTFESLVRTLDGGESWMSVYPLSDGCVSGGMIFVDEQEGWIGDDCRGLSNTLDGIPVQDFLNGKATPSLNRTTDGGNTWSSFPVPAPAVFPLNFTSLDIDPNTWVYCGIKQMHQISQKTFLLQWSCNTAHSITVVEASYAYLTNDGGQTWHSWLSTGNETFTNPDTGWRLFATVEDQPSLLQQTTNGGLTWRTIKEVAWKTAQFNFVNEQVGWANVSNNMTSTLVHTVDGGKTWIEIKPAIVP